MAPADDPVLGRFRTALDQVYGRWIEQVVLFGSRARGDASPDSDYDLETVETVTVSLIRGGLRKLTD